MPRTRRPRTIGGEDQLANRVRAEMSRKHWSYNILASAMRDVGVDISPSSLQKSFTYTTEQRRPIRVDELIALAIVFQTSVENLLTPRDWVDQEQVDKARTDMHRADRLLVEAVQTMLDAQIMLLRATAHTPAEHNQPDEEQDTTDTWAKSDRLRIRPQTANDNSPQIGTQAIGARLAALKTIIHDIANDWYQIETLNLPIWRLPSLPIIGSRPWDHAKGIPSSDDRKLSDDASLSLETSAGMPIQDAS